MLLLNDKYRFLLDFVTDLGWPKVRGEYLVDRQWYSKWSFPFILINFYRGKKWSSFMLVHVRHEWRSHVLLFHFLPVHSTEERMWLDLMHPSSTSTQTVFRLSVRQHLLSSEGAWWWCLWHLHWSSHRTLGLSFEWHIPCWDGLCSWRESVLRAFHTCRFPEFRLEMYQLPEIRESIEILTSDLFRWLVVNGFGHCTHLFVFWPFEDAVDAEITQLDVAISVDEDALRVEVAKVKGE